MQVYSQEDNLIFERGEGVYLYDIEGRKYIDAISSLWCNVHGHNHPHINRAIIEQLSKVAHTTTLGSSNIPAIMLSKKLCEIAPEGLTKVFYSEDGSEAVEVAIKMAYQYWKHKGEDRRGFISFDGAYHGDTLGAVSVGGIGLFHEAFRDLIFKVHRLPSPYLFCKENKLEDSKCVDVLVELLRRVIEESQEGIVATIMEGGIQGAAGMLPYPKGLLKKVSDLCKEKNVLLIVDEVATGFGRTGSMFYCEQESVSPDFLCLGKGLSGGYLPLAATLTKDEVFEAFLGEFGQKRQFYHGHTYTGNNLGCAAALASLEVFEKENTLSYLPEKIEFLKELLKELSGLKYVWDIRRLGFMAGIELRQEGGEAFDYGMRVGFKVARACRDMGVFLRPLGDTMVIMLPLCADKEHIHKTVNSLKLAIENLSI